MVVKWGKYVMPASLPASTSSSGCVDCVFLVFAPFASANFEIGQSRDCIATSSRCLLDFSGWCCCHFVGYCCSLLRVVPSSSLCVAYCSSDALPNCSLMLRKFFR
ncbi:hypothetical protein Patl1_34538 [Pistacia atlantica]|uniref:Uncharacterized protein n=1 Tax=Pistacia atlantica TaxID=434234 RepID=A0ACC0ZQ09_9ROSI|nr:hypothetical protein Patl1_34538 [Pistacia atlantica]